MKKMKSYGMWALALIFLGSVMTARADDKAPSKDKDEVKYEKKIEIRVGADSGDGKKLKKTIELKIDGKVVDKDEWRKQWKEEGKKWRKKGKDWKGSKDKKDWKNKKEWKGHDKKGKNKRKGRKKKSSFNKKFGFTEEQNEKLRKLKSAQRENMKSLRKERSEAMKALREALGRDAKDAELKKYLGRLEKIKEKERVQRSKDEKKMKSILTVRQQALSAQRYSPQRREQDSKKSSRWSWSDWSRGWGKDGKHDKKGMRGKKHPHEDAAKHAEDNE